MTCIKPLRRVCRLHRAPFHCLLLVLLAMLAAVPAAPAQEAGDPLPSPDADKVAERQQARRLALNEERTALERLREQVTGLTAELPTRLQALPDTEVTESVVNQVQLDTNALGVQQKDLQTTIDNSRKQSTNLQQAIGELQARMQLLENPAKAGMEGDRRLQQLELARRDLALQQAELELEQQHLAHLQERLQLTEKQLNLVEQWRVAVTDAFRRRQEQNRRQAEEKQLERLEQGQKAQLEQAAQWREQLTQRGEKLADAERRLLETRIQAAEETAGLLALDIRLRTADTLFDRWTDGIEQPDIAADVLQQNLHAATTLDRELRERAELLLRKEALFVQQQQVIEQRDDADGADRRLQAEEARLTGGLLEAVQQRRTELQARLDRIDALRDRLQGAYRERLGETLLMRRTLPANAEEWQALFTGIRAAPGVLLHQVRLSLEAAGRVFLNATAAQWLQLAGLEALLLVLAALVRQRLRRLLENYPIEADGLFADRLAWTLVRLLYRNLGGIILAAALALALWWLDVPQPAFGILLTLVLVRVGIKIPVDLAWLLLAAPELLADRQRLRLYRQVRWTLMLFGLLAAVTILAHLSAAPVHVSLVFDRLFMASWLVLALPLHRLRRTVLEALAPRFDNRFWFGNLRLFSTVLPFGLLAAAGLGLIGYVALAWTVAWYLLMLVGAGLGWLFLRSLLDDLIVLLKNYANAHATYGVLWTQEIIAPLHQILRGLLLLATLVVLIGGFTRFTWEALLDEPQQKALVQLLWIGLGTLLGYIVCFLAVSYAVERTGSKVGGGLIRHARQPVGLILPVAVMQFTLPVLALPADTVTGLAHLLGLVQIAAVAWLLVRLMNVVEDLIGQHYLLTARDNVAARRVHTQFQMVRRMVLIVVYVVTLAAILMTFPRVRQLGAGLLASAGVAGLVIGVAARPFLENLIAGVQIGLTQPMRIEDIVVVEGEWGRVAEINATHVVLRLWDERRLVLPISYFMTKPFENWTRTGTELMGSAFFYVDFTFPVAAGRAKLKEILDGSGLWDGRSWSLQVTGVSERTVELRAVMSVRDASAAWDLRCLVRERFIRFLQEDYPECLPQSRMGSGSPPTFRVQTAGFSELASLQGK